MDGDGQVEIRAASLPADAGALAEVYRSSAAHHVGLHPDVYRVPEPAAVAARYRDPSAQAGVTILVAEVGSAVVGAAAVRLLPLPDSASMLAPVRAASIDVAVLGGHRGRGIGERLMTAAQAVARERGAARVVLDVAAANERALRFYQERLGYRPFGVLLVSDLDPSEDAPPATVDGEPER